MLHASALPSTLSLHGCGPRLDALTVITAAQVNPATLGFPVTIVSTSIIRVGKDVQVTVHKFWTLGSKWHRHSRCTRAASIRRDTTRTPSSSTYVEYLLLHLD